MDVSKKIT